jgi:pyrroloquinoline quinone biosynthesis protein B
MRVRVLGSAAGGGSPQWNCGCDNCCRLRSGALVQRSRLQDSLAVSADGERWLLLNASPDLRAQIENFCALWPRAARHSPIAAVALTNGDLDHVLGLLTMRESERLMIFATRSVRGGLVEHNAMLRTLDRFEGHTQWRDLEPGRALSVVDASGADLGLSIEAVIAPGKLPLHLAGVCPPDELDNIGLLVRERGGDRTLAYFPGVAGQSAAVARALARSHTAFFDGTFFSSDELIRLGVGLQRAEAMAHWPLSGDGGSLRWLEGRCPRLLLTHINNTNPLLEPTSAARSSVAAAAIEVAEDELEVTL